VGCIYLSAKAADARQAVGFAYWLATTHDDRTLHARYRISACWGLWSYYECIMHAGKWLTDQEVSRAETGLYTFFSGYMSLRAEALEQGHTACWRPKPKFHLMIHLVDDFVVPLHINPRDFWCYMSEDFVGKMKRLAKACHRSSIVGSLLKRYLVGKSIELKSV
jgi:hypothetical protein